LLEGKLSFFLSSSPLPELFFFVLPREKILVNSFSLFFFFLSSRLFSFLPAIVFDVIAAEESFFPPSFFFP